MIDIWVGDKVIQDEPTADQIDDVRKVLITGEDGLKYLKLAFVNLPIPYYDPTRVVYHGDLAKFVAANWPW